MRNAIDACKRHGSALVFFHNVYAYGRVDGVMTEDTPYNPCSRKGEVRARIATIFMDEVKRGQLRGMIVRSADFYGPSAALSLTHATVTSVKAKKTPQSRLASMRRGLVCGISAGKSDLMPSTLWVDVSMAVRAVGSAKNLRFSGKYFTKGTVKTFLILRPIITST